MKTITGQVSELIGAALDTAALGEPITWDLHWQLARGGHLVYEVVVQMPSPLIGGGVLTAVGTLRNPHKLTEADAAGLAGQVTGQLRTMAREQLAPAAKGRRR